MTRYERIAIDWLRALRGRRSQRGYSRRLGYKSNIAYRWESGRCWPTARTVLRAMTLLKHDVRGAFVRFHGSPPKWFADCDPTSRDGVARTLDELRGATPVVQLAATSGFSRHQVARWIAGATEPRLPEWLALIDATSFRLLDFIAAFFDPQKLPAIAKEWRRLQAVRESAYTNPESHIVLRALELVEYRRLPVHSDAFLAEKLTLQEHEVRACVSLLAAAGQIRRVGRKWIVREQSVVDTRHDPVRSRALKAWWLRRAAGYVESGREGIYGYNVFSVSRRDLARLRELHLRYYREMQELIAQSKPSEHVALFAAQLIGLDEPDARVR